MRQSNFLMMALIVALACLPSAASIKCFMSNSNDILNPIKSLNLKSSTHCLRLKFNCTSAIATVACKGAATYVYNPK